MPVLLGVSLVLLVAVLVSLGTAATARSWSEGFTSWLVQSFVNVPILGGYVAREAVKLSRWITHHIGEAFGTLAAPVVGWIAGLTQYVATVATAALAWPIELFRLQAWLISTAIPNLIRALPTRIEHVVTTTAKVVHEVVRTVVHETKVVVSKARTVVVQEIPWRIRRDFPALDWLRVHLHALSVALPHALPVPFGRTVTDIRRRLKRLERVTAGGIAVAAVVAALGKLGLGWLRCRNPSKIGKALCGIPGHFADDLLGLFVDYMVLTNICRVLPWLERGFADVAEPLVSQLSQAGAGACGAGVAPAAHFDVPRLYLPADVGL